MPSVSWGLVIAYALFRVFEYFALKGYQGLFEERQLMGGGVHTKGLTIMGAVLLPARIAGWGILIWAVVKFGFLPTLAFMFGAFLLSLVLQFTLGPLLWSLFGGAAPVVFLAAVPIMVVVIALILAST